MIVEVTVWTYDHGESHLSKMCIDISKVIIVEEVHHTAPVGDEPNTVIHFNQCGQVKYIQVMDTYDYVKGKWCEWCMTNKINLDKNGDVGLISLMNVSNCDD